VAHRFVKDRWTGGGSVSDKVVFCTGAGGFIGRYILSHYLETQDSDLYLLEYGQFRDRLEAFLDEHLRTSDQRARVHVVSGNIAEPGLGLAPAVAEELRARVTHAIHLAALYNLAAPRDISVRINVDGTRHVLEFLRTARAFERLLYVSTVAVVGTHSGTFREGDLDVGQRFRNHYEETKFLAERVVREQANAIPTVIVRPATVVGHSRTGAIEKIDGPYYALGMIARNMHRIVPDTGDARFQFAPVDFIADAAYHLFEDEASVGKVFHLVDPEPLTYMEFIEMACRVMGRPKPLLALPAALMRPMGRLPMFERVTGVPPEAFEQSFYSVDYDTTNATAALTKHGVACPSVSSYIDVMVNYFVEHANDPQIRKGNWRQATT
jgi:thioester reductase-like protein